MSNVTVSVQIEVDGLQLALIRSVAFLASIWDFGDNDAKAAIGPDQERYELLNEDLRRQSDDIYRRADVLEVPPEGWSPSFAKARGSVHGTLVVTPTGLDEIIQSLLACQAEFSDAEAWIDFHILSRGNIDTLPLSWNDFPPLLTFLRSFKSHQSS